MKANRARLAWQHFAFSQVARLLTYLTTWPGEHLWAILGLSLVSKWVFCPILLNILTEKLKRTQLHLPTPLHTRLHAARQTTQRLRVMQLGEVLFACHAEDKSADKDYRRRQHDGFCSAAI